MYIVKDIATRNSIPAADRTDGDAVFVSGIGQTFFLRGGITNSHWSGPSEWATTADMDLYVDPAGDDDAGTGAVGAPYLTIDRAYEDVPFLIKHNVHVRIAAGTYTSFPKSVRNEYEGDGQLSFDGVAEISDDLGTLTVNTAVQLGTTQMYEINVAGAGWVVDAHKEKILRIESGANAGEYAVVWSNTADTMKVFFASGSLMIGTDTFIVGDPQVIVNNTTNLIKIEAIDKETTNGMNSSSLARIGLGFITFNATNDVIKIQNSVVVLAYCVLSSATDWKTPLSLVNSIVNQQVPPTVAGMFTKITVAAYAGQIGVAKFNAANQKIPIDGTNYLMGFLFRGKINISLSSLGVYFCAFGLVNCTQGLLNTNGLYVGMAGEDSLQFWVNSSGRLISSYFGEGTYCLEMDTGSVVYINNITGGNYTQYAAKMGPGCLLHVDDALAVTVATGDIWWVQTAAGAGEPAAGAAETDSQGSFYVRSA